MGQILFFPPNVKGWDGGAAWLNSQTVLTRENFASSLMAKMGDARLMDNATPLTSTMNPASVARALTATILQGDVSPASTAAPRSPISTAPASARWRRSPAKTPTNASAAPRTSPWRCPPTNSHKEAIVKRNAFLLGAASGLAVVGHADGSLRARAWRKRRSAASDDRVLVIVNFQGGNDGLNTVVPFGMPAYYKYRPSLARRAERRAAHQRHGRPQSGAEAVQGYVRQGAGRDRSRRRLSEARLTRTSARPRFGRRRRRRRTSRPAGSAATSTTPTCRRAILFNAVAVADVLPEVLVADRDRRAGDRATQRLRLGERPQQERSDATSSTRSSRTTNVPFRSPYLAHVAEIEDHAQRGAEELPQLVAGYKPAGTYPATPIGRSLALAAQIDRDRSSERACSTCSTARSTRTRRKRRTQDRLLATSPTR